MAPHLPDRLTTAARRVDGRRIAALSVAIALHVVALLFLLAPARPLGDLAGAVEELVVELIPAARDPAPAPPSRPPPEVRPPLAPATPAAEPAPARAPPRRTPAWEFDPEAGVALVVYGDRPALDLEMPDTPPAEIPLYRQAFDPARIEGLDGVDAHGSAVFDVLVDETGTPSALVIRRQACSERALETAMAVIGQWRFTPATKGNVPIPAWLEVELTF